MNPYAPTRPATTGGAIRAMAEIIRAHDVLMAELGSFPFSTAEQVAVGATDNSGGEETQTYTLQVTTGHKHVYEDERPETAPHRYVVVREPQVPGGLERHFTGIQTYPIQILVAQHQSIRNARTFLREAHAEIYKVLAGRKLTQLWDAVHLLRVRQARLPSPVTLDDDYDEYFSTAEWWVTLKPNLE